MLQLWLPLFVSFLMAFVSAVLVWWRLASDGRQQKAERIISALAPDAGYPRTTVLQSPAPARKPHGKLNGQWVAAAGLAILGALIGSRLTNTFGPLAIVLGAAPLGALPWLRASHQKRARLAAFEEQFPEALDFLARSLRAGNAFSIGMELLAAESVEPTRSEFLRVSREQALGSPLDTALNGLAARVGIIEVRFFVSAVLLQRETGGNLAEILAKLAGSVRERLRLRGHVKAASSQARLTARILSALPVGVMVLLKVMSPSYLEALTADATGRTLLAAAAMAQVLAYVCMKKITNIEV